MTTIAYRAGIIAADTSMTIGDARVGTTVKVARNAKGELGGAAGSSTYAAAFRKWLESNEPQDKRPEAKSDANYLDRGFIARQDGHIEVFEPGGSFYVTAAYYAIGSGAAEARGAMFAGADAVTAIKAALAHDAYTGGDITVLKASDA